MTYIARAITPNVSGSQADFSVPFPFIERSHVHVYTRVPSTDALVEEASGGYSWTSDSLIHFTVAPWAGLTVEIHRITPIDAALTRLGSGSTVTSDIINAMATQLLYISQEIDDAFLAVPQIGTADALAQVKTAAAQAIASQIAAAGSASLAYNILLTGQALANGWLYVDTTTALAARAEGDPFLVQGAPGSTTFGTLYRKTSGAAVAQGLAIPSLAATTVTATVGTRIGRPKAGVTSGLGALTGNTFWFKPAMPAGGSINLDAYCFAPGDIKVGRFTLSGSTYTFVSGITIKGYPGPINLTNLPLSPVAGERLGVYAPGVLVYDGGAVDGGSYDYAAGDVTTSAVATLNFTDARIMLGITVNSVGTEPLADKLDRVSTTGTSGQSVAQSALGKLSSASKTLSTPLLYPPALLTTGGWNIIIVYGQSLSVGYNSVPLISTTQPYSNLTFGSGVRSAPPGNTVGAGNTSPGTATTKALVEESGNLNEGTAGGAETCCSSMANGLTTRMTRRGYSPSNVVVFASAPGHGGYRLDQLITGTPWYNQMFLGHTNAAVARAIAAGKASRVIAVLWMQGESDAIAGTSRATYLAGMGILSGALGMDLGSTVHLLTYQTASTTGTLANLNAIQLAQLDAARANAYIHLISPIYHLPGAADSLHEGGVGEWLWGRIAARALDQMCVEKRVPDRIEITSAVSSGTTLTLCFDVPTLPLVLDDFLPVATDYGFKAVDDTGTLVLSNIAVQADGRSVKLTLNRALGANPKVRYGLDFKGSGLLVSASGNLRDSTPDLVTCPYNSVAYQLFHVCPALEQPIYTVEAV